MQLYIYQNEKNQNNYNNQHFYSDNVLTDELFFKDIEHLNLTSNCSKCQNDKSHLPWKSALNHESKEIAFIEEYICTMFAKNYSKRVKLHMYEFDIFYRSQDIQGGNDLYSRELHKNVGVAVSTLVFRGEIFPRVPSRIIVGTILYNNYSYLENSKKKKKKDGTGRI